MQLLVKLSLYVALCSFITAASAAESTAQVIKRQAPTGITPAFFTCIDEAGSNPGGSGSCINAEKSRQDARLNASYKALMAKLGSKAKENLVIAERNWIALQKSNNAFEASLYPDETVADLQVAQSEAFRICERANALDKYLTVANEL